MRGMAPTCHPPESVTSAICPVTWRREQWILATKRHRPGRELLASATACSQSRSVAGRGVADHAGKPIGHPGTARDLADVLDLHAVRACWLLQQI